MALTYSSMLNLGTHLPEFELENALNGQKIYSNSLSKDKGKVIMFICNHCPYVIHYHSQIANITKQYSSDIEFIAISSNDANDYPEDSPEKMQELAQKLGFEFPYLYDKTQNVAKKYKAVCTPEFYLFDRDDLLIYRGRFDDSSPGKKQEIVKNDLQNAIDNFLANRNISDEQYPSMGCSIKWK